MHVPPKRLGNSKLDQALYHTDAQLAGCYLDQIFCFKRRGVDEKSSQDLPFASAAPEPTASAIFLSWSCRSGSNSCWTTSGLCCLLETTYSARAPISPCFK